ncbi:MAG TPA: hypothetical protein VMS31_05630 [Pyrinomonadaceae bacterium]|nr:hypothetical protein [Pyrinomonadaceae bacterium]
MRPGRIFAFVIGCVALALSLRADLEYIHLLGFPDGFITELGYAQRRLALLFIGVSVVFASCFFYLGWVASRKQIGKKLFIAMLVYVLFIITISLIDHHYRLTLTDGGGG